MKQKQFMMLAALILILGVLLAACSRDDAVWSYRWDGRNLPRQDVLPLHQASCVLPLP